MEAMAALFTSAAAGGATAGTVAGTIGPTAGFASSAATLAGGAASAAGGGGLFSMAGLFSVAEGIFSLASGFAQASSLNQAAEWEDIRAQQELLQGRREALEIAESLNETLAHNLVATAASGIAFEGGPVEGQRAAVEKADFETSITRENATINAKAREASADQLRADAGSAILGGFMGAAKAGGRYAYYKERRGK